MISKQRKPPSQVQLSPALTMTLRIKVYKTHIKQWGLDKKNKENEMRAVIRKTACRATKGKDSTFYIRGKTVDFENVVRYWQRKGVFSIDEIIARREASKTPEAVECYTPVLSPLRTPDELARDERMLVAVRDYQQLSLQTGMGSSSILTQLTTLYSLSILSCDLFHKQSSHEAGQALIKATAGIQSIVQAQSPDSVSYMLGTIQYLHSHNKAEIAKSILRQFAAMSHHLFPSEHPSRIIWSRLASVDLSDRGHFGHVSRLSMRVNVDWLEKLLGPLHHTTIGAKLEVSASYRGSQLLRQRELGLQSLFRECELTYGPDHDRTSRLGLELAWYYLENDNPMEAKRRAQAVCNKTRSKNWRVYGLEPLARLQHKIGEMVAAEENMRKAVDLGITIWGCHDGEVHQMMLELEDWLAEQGELDSAAQLREERMGYWEPVELL